MQSSTSKLQIPDLDDVVKEYEFWKDYSDKVLALVQNAEKIRRKSRDLERYSVAIQKLIQIYVIDGGTSVTFDADCIRCIKNGEYIYEDERVGLHVRVYERLYCSHYESELMHLFTLKIKGPKHEVIHEGSVRL